MFDELAASERRADTIRRAVAWAHHASRLCDRPTPEPSQLMALAAARMRYLALLLPAEEPNYMDLAKFFDAAARDTQGATMLAGRV